MQVRHSVMVGVLGRYADRFHEYQPPRAFAGNLELARRIAGADGIEVVYPQDFADVDETIRLIERSGLPVSAVNVNVKSEAKWRTGSFTSPDPAIRAEAVRYLKVGMDLARELGAGMVTCCPLIDGWDYSFQVDYAKQWSWLVECISEAARYRPEVKLSLEYKPFEARNSIVLPNLGTTLHLCNVVGQPNVGVTMDVGHALTAGETPAASATIALAAGRLFYVHFNDNNRLWDWDMIPATVHVWEVIETLFYLHRLNWSGWLSYDVFVKNGNPEEAIEATIAIMRELQAFVESHAAELESIVQEGIPARNFKRLVPLLLRGRG
ncbi:sugar phosphate isomerase/epimerase [Carboxydochorda subterranea]|uniref:Xylose isomerase n=1 Tax=Carboxydichorda subterranea TaxID=3109565 RepID=A0ABZ1C135_9FIRM|nr:sugar phosphate isomerase/epimerase [Limnochorda sp. L945t]WRP18737.1 sugar phosphate isomerase/epimerase [Limnochorda sp. L945t]